MARALRKTDRQRYLEILLTDWGVAESELNGYPPRTAESSAGEGVSSNKPGSRLPRGVIHNSRLDGVRTAVNALGDFYPLLKRVVEIRYHPDLDNESAQVRAFSAEMKQGHRAYYEWLGRAHAWLDGRLL